MDAEPKNKQNPTPIVPHIGFYCFCSLFLFWLVVFPQNCYRPGPHKIDLTVAEKNLGFCDVLAKKHCKTQCIPSKLNCYRPGPHKIDLKIVENLGFCDVLAKKHCKTECF